MYKRQAKSICDCLIFVAHWGTEDETMPNEYEKQWAAFLMEQGVDVIIGGHPHVLQPYGRLSEDVYKRQLWERIPMRNLPLFSQPWALNMM